MCPSAFSILGLLCTVKIDVINTGVLLYIMQIFSVYLHLFNTCVILWQNGGSFFLSGLVMGPGQKLLTWVRSGQFFCGSSGVGSGWVIHLWFEFKFGKLPLKMSNFSIFALQVKKISSGRVKKYPGCRRVGLLFTASQK